MKLSDECADCKEVVKIVEGALGDTTLQHDILNELEQVCNALGQYKSTCQSFVLQYGPMLISYLVKVDPSTVCGGVGLCTSMDTDALMQVAIKAVTEIKVHPMADECTDCKMFFGDVQKELMDPNNQQTIISAIEQVCSLLGDLSSECQSLVDQYGSLVINALAQVLDPQNTCSTIGFCSTQLVMKEHTGDVCTDCKHFFTDVQHKLEDPTLQKEVLTDLEQVCSLLGEYESECTSLIDQYGPVALTLLVSQLKPETICQAIEYCQSSQPESSLLDHLVKSIVTRSDDTVGMPTSDGCADCTAFFGDVQDIFANYTVQKMLVSDLDKVCGLLADPLSCKQAIDEYSGEVFDFIAQQISAGSVCKTIGFCMNGNRRVKAADPCTDCKNFFADVQNILQNYTVQNEIISELSQVCSLLGQYESQCRSLIQQYGPMAINFLASELEPSSVCGTIGFCQGFTVPKMSQLITNFMSQIQGDMCTDCKAFFGDIQNMLLQPDTQKQIISEVELVCSLLGDLESQCKSLVEGYGNMVLEVLVNLLTPDTICQTINYCTMDGKETFLKTRNSGADVCTDCKMFFGDVQMALMDMNKQQTIISAVEQVCSLLGDLSSECQSLVDQYGSLVINALAQVLDPQNTCNVIGYCNTRQTMQSDKKPSAQAILRQNMVAISPAADIITSSNEQVGDDSLCSVCEIVLGIVETQLTLNKTEEEIVNVISELCQLLPGMLELQCTEFVKAFGPALISLLATDIEPSKICNTLGLCTTSLHDVPLPDIPKVADTPQNEKDSAECVICEFVMKELEDLIGSNATEAEIKAALEKVCSYLPTTVQETCNEFVDGYTTEIIDLILQYENPDQVCSQLSLCTTSKKKADNVSFGPQCLLCEQVLKKLEDMLLSNATEEEIESALEKVCSLLPSEYRAECDQLVKDYTPIIVNLVLKDVGPEAICALIGLCVGDNKVQAVVPVKPVEAGDDYCVLCEFIMKEVEDELEKNSTEAEIKAALEKVCSVLPSTILSECSDFVEQYLPVLLNLLVKEVSPEFICTRLKFCPGTDVHHSVLLAKAALMKKVEVDASETCIICEFILKEIDSLLSENATKEEIVTVVENICTVLPGNLRQECDSFLNTYGSVLITLIVQQLDPSTICSELGLCKDSSKSAGHVKAAAPTPECAFCEFIMAQVKDLISKNSTEEEIKKALDDVCSILPTKFKTDCLLFVNRYSDVIIKLLVQEIDPTQICTLLQMCTATVQASDDECDLCQILVKFADDFIRSNSTEEEIIKGLLDVCSILPGNLKDQCTNIITQYGTAIPGLIAELLSPLKVCEVLGLCSQGKLGATLCSRGPATWCASMENAKLCNAVSHCQRHAWN